jgi:DNA-binding NarL/FixJ family response regulator
MGKPRLLLADDHTLILEAFTRLLEDEFEIAGVVTDGISLLKEAPALKPDVVVLDLGMPRLNGMDAGKELKRLLPSTKIVVLTMSEDFELATEALRRWASAYLLKKSAGHELTKAIHEVLKHRTYVTPQIAQCILEEFVRDPRPDHKNHLTNQQRRVLQLLAEGLNMKEAAAALNISTRTVAFHKYQIMHEHGLKNNADIVMFAIKERVVVPTMNVK